MGICKEIFYKIWVSLMIIAILCSNAFISRAFDDECGNLDIVLSTDAVISTSFFHGNNTNYYKEVYYSITDNDGNYLCFNNNFEYTGKQSEQYIITVFSGDWQSCNEGRSSKVTLTGIPNGEYKIEFAKYNDAYVKKTDDPLFDFLVIPHIENENFSINGNTVEANTNISLKCKHNYYLYYIDETGKNPEIIWNLYNRGEGKLNFTYSVDEDGNNVYTWAQDGNLSDIKIVDRQRTIVTGLPWLTSLNYSLSANLSFGTCLQDSTGHAMSSGNASEDSEYQYNSFSNSIPSPLSCDYGLIYTSTEGRKAYTINKQGTDGNVANGKFTLYRDYEKAEEAIFDYFDTYELDGKEYTNAYVIKGWVQSGENENYISTINGKATIIYPLIDYNSLWRPLAACLSEKEADSEHFSDGDKDIDYIIGQNYGIKTMQNGEQLSNKDRFIIDHPEAITYDDLEVEIVTDVPDEIEKDVVNQNKPKVTKIVLDENGNVINNCKDTFRFGLFNNANKLISTVELNANETKCFDVQLDSVDEEGYYASQDNIFYIAEYEDKNYSLKDITSATVNDGGRTVLNQENSENIIKDVYKYKYNADEAVSVVFTNMVETITIEGKKIWNDENNKYGKRPESIVIKLLANGNVVKDMEVKADENGEWLFSFDNLLKYENGKEIEYTISEEKIEGYETNIEGNTIINTIVNTDKKDENKPEKPQENIKNEEIPEKPQGNIKDKEIPEKQQEDKSISKLPQTGENSYILSMLLITVLTSILFVIKRMVD